MNNSEIALTGDNAIVRDVLGQYVAGFEAHGFEYARVTLEGSAKLGLYPCFHFSNKALGVWLHASFWTASNGLNGLFVVSLESPANRSLDIEDFLKLHGRDELTKYFTYRDPNTDVRDFADSFFRMLLGLFDTDLKPILEGKEFEETPIDWMGYK